MTAQQGITDLAELCVPAGILVSAAVLAGLSWRCRKSMVSRGRGGAAGAVPPEEPRVRGMPLGRELFDALFSPAAVPDGSACIVCLLPMGLAEPCRRLGCYHAFHSECIDRWWLQTGDAKLRCPVCRRAQAPSRAEVSV
jgi:hypothetical protein